MIDKGLTLEQAAEVAIDAGGHLSIIDESTGLVVIEDTDGDCMTIGATEKLLVEYEKSGKTSEKAFSPTLDVRKVKYTSKPDVVSASSKKPEPEPEPEPVRPRFLSAPKRMRRP